MLFPVAEVVTFEEDEDRTRVLVDRSVEIGLLVVVVPGGTDRVTDLEVGGLDKVGGTTDLDVVITGDGFDEVGGTTDLDVVTTGDGFAEVGGTTGLGVVTTGGGLALVGAALGGTTLGLPTFGLVFPRPKGDRC